MKVKHITLLTALAVIALLFVGGAAASGLISDQSTVSSLSNFLKPSDFSSSAYINAADNLYEALYYANDHSQLKRERELDSNSQLKRERESSNTIGALTNSKASNAFGALTNSDSSNTIGALTNSKASNAFGVFTNFASSNAAAGFFNR